MRPTILTFILLASLAPATQALAQSQGGANKTAADAFKRCATLYNIRKSDADAIAACDQAIAADPKLADA